MKTFTELGLSKATLQTLSKKGFEVPTPIQEQVIPALLNDKLDIIGQAQTGTGKTAAFGLPLIERLNEKSSSVQTLILTPTRELAIQVAEEIQSLKGKKRFNILPIYGGQAISLQLRQLKKGVDIVVGTPGRIIDHLKRKTLKLDRISYLILDEADEMLNMGFLEDVTSIMEQTNDDKRTLLFSATMPQEILRIAKKYMGEYQLYKTTHGQITVRNTDQIYFEVKANDKFEALCRIIDLEEDFYGLIFCRTKVDVDNVAAHLADRGYDSDALHGDISQNLREKILKKFKKGLINILVATDVAARGIDIQNLTHVINYALPQDPESYVHRVGRTGRAGKDGIAITFITPSEYRKLQHIQRKTKTEIRKEKLPKVTDIIKAKKNRIKALVNELVQMEPLNSYYNLAKELLEQNNPTEIVSALLCHFYQDELNESTYTEIQDVTVDMKGKTRLFVSQGKIDGLTKNKLIKFITDNCRIPQKKIRDIEILDKFSFVTLPFHEAETLLEVLKKRRRGSGPKLTKAKSPRSEKQGKRKKNPGKK
ncbi:MAG: DEAD/DEAH box helicase [Candidatus Omnitrophica bacterium]|nr:DEAD/DEAH box helicase [Candidatus Omnitrophota bacterium]